MKPLAPFTPAKVYPAWMMARCIAFPFPVPFLARVTSAERYRVILAKHRRPGGSRRDAGARYANARILAGATESIKADPERTGLAGLPCWKPSGSAAVHRAGLRCIPVRDFSRRGTVCANFLSRGSRQVRFAIMATLALGERLRLGGYGFRSRRFHYAHVLLLPPH
jgi:hypothetical protein